MIDSGKLAKLTELIVFPVTSPLQNKIQLTFRHFNALNLKLQLQMLSLHQQ